MNELSTQKEPMGKKAESPSMLSLDAHAGIASLVSMANQSIAEEKAKGMSNPPDPREIARQVGTPESVARFAESVARPAFPQEAEALMPPTETVTYSPPVSKEAAAHPKFNPSRIFFTGRLKAGKDHSALAIGAAVIGFAEPLYWLRETFFGAADKDKFGARKFLQQVGQWGRGILSDEYPMTTERACFVHMIRSGGFEGFDVDWSEFGKNENLWLDAMVIRAMRQAAHNSRMACVNVRFTNEYRKLIEDGWTHFHVICSPQTLDVRHRNVGLSGAAALTDLSERMALQLDDQALKAGRQMGAKLKVIWNDDQVPSPSKRFFTLHEFKEACNANDTGSE